MVDTYGLAQVGRSAEVQPITGTFAGEMPVGSFIAQPPIGTTALATMVSQANPSTAYGAVTQITVSAGTGNANQGLFRYDNIFGTNPGQLDNQAVVVSAKVILTAGAVSSPAPTIRVHRMLANWDNTSTWNSMVGGISADGVEAVAAAEASAVPNYAGTAVTFDVTRSIQAWQGNTAGNRGWALLASSSYQTIFRTIRNPPSPALEISYEASAVAFTTPAVNIREDGGTVMLTVTRTGNLSTNLNVAYAASGGALSGADYTDGSGTLTWGPNDSTPRLIQIPIVNDSLVEGDETFRVNLTVTSGLGIVDTPGSVLVTILEKPFNVWRFAKFGANANSAQAFEDADPDNDGVNNLLEYAADTNPLVANLTAQPTIGGTDFLTLTFLRNTSATDLVYTVRASGDMAIWEDGSTYSASTVIPTNDVTTEVSRTDAGPVETIVVRDNISIASAPARYLRLQVTRVP